MIGNENNNLSTSDNCQACGVEFSVKELSTVKLSGFNSAICICKYCLSKTAEDSFKDAADLLDEIILIAKATGKNPERRIQAIKKLIGE